LITGILYLFLIQFLVILRRDLQATVAGGEAVLTVLDSSDEAIEAGFAPGLTITIHDAATLGRGPGSAIVIPDSLVSLVHARLLYQDGEWWIEDLGSTNGTFVDGEAVRERHRLAAGNVLNCGPRIRLRIGET
jgi:pSer/pThr/pTyr-binding forkhead associated (FHA) protein